MPKIVGTGDYTYEVNEEWAQLPEGWDMPAASVFGDSQDRVFCFSRSPDHHIVIFDREGNYLHHWDAGPFTFAHAIFIDHEGMVWLIDRDIGQVFKYTPEGQLLLTIGTRDYQSDTGMAVISSSLAHTVVRPGEPFNLPAGVAVAPSGDIFIADGYGNCRIHKFTSEGKLILSWGEPGSGPGQFILPHDVWIDRRGRVLVADRENNRVQVFTQEGEHLDIWPTEFVGPAALYVDDDDVVYVAEHNGGDTSIVTLDGQLLARWGGPVHRSTHGVWVDSHKDLYVAQPPESGGTRRVIKFLRQG